MSQEKEEEGTWLLPVLTRTVSPPVLAHRKENQEFVLTTKVEGNSVIVGLELVKRFTSIIESSQRVKIIFS